MGFQVFFEKLHLQIHSRKKSAKKTLAEQMHFITSILIFISQLNGDFFIAQTIVRIFAYKFESQFFVRFFMIFMFSVFTFVFECLFVFDFTLYLFETGVNKHFFKIHYVSI